MTTPEPTSPTRGSLAVIFLTVFIDLLGFAMVLPLLPVYARQFGEDQHGWITATLMASFSVMQFLFAPLWGRLSDRIGRRPVLLVGLAGAAVFYGVFGLATMWHSVTWLFVSRIGAGIACATIPVAQAYIADSTTLETRARGMALIGAAFGVGFCIGPLFGIGAIWLSPDPSFSPWPGFTASILSLVAFLLALARLPESLRPGKSVAAERTFSIQGWREAMSIPSVPALLLTSFISVVSFGGFETTLGLLIKDRPTPSGAPSLFHFTEAGVLAFFSYIGLVLSIVQGGIVRRLAGKISEGVLAKAGAAFSLLGFALLTLVVYAPSLALLMLASAIEVAGFALMSPTLQSLISRRSDPEKQGSIAGVSQSISAMARIVGPLYAIPLFSRDPMFPYAVSAMLMVLAVLVMQFAVRGGGDFTPVTHADREKNSLKTKVTV